MAIQSTPPLPDPTTGRIPSYTQVLQQDEDTGQWVVMYDVSDTSTPTTATTGTITQLPGLTTPITQFPDLEDTTPSVPWQGTPVVPQDPTSGAAAGGGGGRGRNADPEPAGYVTGFDGNFYSAETGEQVSERMQNFLTALQNSSTIMAIGSRVNNTNAISQMSMESQRAMFSSEASQEAWGEMSEDDRRSFRQNLAVNARRNGVPASQVSIGNRRSSGLGGEEGPPSTPDAITGRMDRRAPPGPTAAASRTGMDSNFGGPAPGTGAEGPAGGASTGGNYGGPAPGTGSGSMGPAGGAQSGGPPGARGGPAGGASSGGNYGGNTGGMGAMGRGGDAGPGRGGHHGDGGGGNGGGSGGGSSCFVKGTLIQMQNNTTKAIDEIKVGDNTKGGKVWMTMTGAPQTIYNYLGVEVSGSHWVLEDKQFIEVENSKHAVLTDKVEPVYTLITDNHRIFINDIEFADYLQVSDEVWEPHYQTVKENLNKELRGEANG